MREQSVDGRVGCIPVLSILVLAMTTSAEERALNATRSHSSYVFRESVVVWGDVMFLKFGAEGLQACRAQRTSVHFLGHPSTRLQNIMYW
jgi:hypothetical protein